jgi:glucans biosynthesis protein
MGLIMTKTFGPVLVAVGLFFLSAVAPAEVFPSTSFGYKDAVAKAKRLAEQPFQEPESVPDFLLKTTYDQWRDIRYKPEKALWHAEKLPFEVQFFHPGSLYNRTVSINVISSGRVHAVPFSPALFHYGMNEFKDQVPKDLGFAGFRIHYPIKTDQYRDEVVIFLGASYFRAVGGNEHFGLSARGVAIDTAMESGEEFPYFREFWLARPRKRADTLTIYALLDSPSLTGAYEFVIKPGKATLIDVRGALFLRREVNKLGIAPLTSMFFYGENTNSRPVDDFRPEVHDSDGLQIISSTGEWIWRPLVNPPRLLTTSFELDNPKGFGLFQRDLDFDHYQDLEADYQTRPSVWITPKSGWGRGRVELVQIPVNHETNDNIVSYWVPADLPKSGNHIPFTYQMKWGPPDISGPSPASVAATRSATDKEKGIKMYLIDFEGANLRSLPKDARLEAVISVDGGEVVEQQLRRNDVTQGWRLVFQVKKKEGRLATSPGNERPLELRAFLRLGDNVLTETWSYVDPF